MEDIDIELTIGKHYSKEELNNQGFTYVKETTITLFYRKADILYIFDAKTDKRKKHKFKCFIED